jgi:hypothetical protein
VSAGVIGADEARTLVEQRALVAKVIKVDDFGPDLGASLMQLPSATRAATRVGEAA